MTNPSLMHETGHSKQFHWDNPEGWNGEEGGSGVWDEGTHVHLWLIHVNIWHGREKARQQGIIIAPSRTGVGVKPAFLSGPQALR